MAETIRMQGEMFAEETTESLPPRVVGTGPRPRPGSEWAVRRAAEAIAPAAAGNLGAGSDAASRAALVQDIVGVHRRYLDGFDLVTKLAGLGYSGSAEAVEDMRRFRDEVDAQDRALVKAWVRQMRVRPCLEVHARVAFRWMGRRKEGLVAGIDRAEAKYLVSSSGIEGLAVVAYENAEALP